MIPMNDSPRAEPPSSTRMFGGLYGLPGLKLGSSPGAGKYFDFEAGNLIVTGSPT